jgi:hypothetical protein
VRKRNRIIINGLLNKFSLNLYICFPSDSCDVHYVIKCLSCCSLPGRVRTVKCVHLQGEISTRFAFQPNIQVLEFPLGSFQFIATGNPHVYIRLRLFASFVYFIVFTRLVSILSYPCPAVWGSTAAGTWPFPIKGSHPNVTVLVPMFSPTIRVHGNMAARNKDLINYLSFPPMGAF